MAKVILSQSVDPEPCEVICETGYGYAMVFNEKLESMITCKKIKTGLYIEVDYDNLSQEAQDIDLLARKLAWDYYECGFDHKDE